MVYHGHHCHGRLQASPQTVIVMVIWLGTRMRLLLQAPKLTVS